MFPILKFGFSSGAGCSAAGCGAGSGFFSSTGGGGGATGAGAGLAANFLVLQEYMVKVDNPISAVKKSFLVMFILNCFRFNCVLQYAQFIHYSYNDTFPKNVCKVAIK
jgi:hypothetical protein